MTAPPPRVLVVGAHWDRGPSMRRYASALLQGYAQLGASARLIAPTNRFSSRVGTPSLRKFVGYIEQLVLFPLTLLLVHRRREVVHFADHSDALLVLGLPPWWEIIVTCHDLIAVRAALGEIPEHRTRRSGRLYQRCVLSGLGRARAVLAVSKATSADLHRLVTGVVTHLVPVPVDPMFAPSTTERQPDRNDYVIVVSGSGYRKRREHAIGTWLRLRTTETLRDTGLVLVGPPLTAEEQRALGPGDATHLRVRSNVSDRELAGLYSGARALIQVSRYEGFGWPIVEANACGTPAICSDSEVFREVGGGAAVFVFEDLDASDWDAVARDICMDEREEAALANAARFSFPRFVEKLGLAVSTLNGEGGSSRA